MPTQEGPAPRAAVEVVADGVRLPLGESPTYLWLTREPSDVGGSEAGGDALPPGDGAAGAVGDASPGVDDSARDEGTPVEAADRPGGSAAGDSDGCATGPGSVAAGVLRWWSVALGRRGAPAGAPCMLRWGRGGVEDRQPRGVHPVP